MARIWPALLLILVACSGSDSGAISTSSTNPEERPAATSTPPTTLPFPAAPHVPDGPLDEETVLLLDELWEGMPETVDTDAIRRLGQSGDPRVAWLIADLLRFAGTGDILAASVQALTPLTGVEFSRVAAWVSVTDHLIAWDIPAPPGYLDYKRRLFTLVDPRWEFVFSEPNDIDMRYLSWGGVLIDDRPLGDTAPCPRGCIPALDDPAVTDAAGGDWYPDDHIVFGVEIGGETRAYPRNIMEVHEMVNDTLGGRRFGMPYCTLCASAQVFFTDDVAGFETPVLRTSGLLSRSNKVMYDLVSMSVFDTFTGAALTGPMREAGVVLEQASVITTTWGEWKAAHPDTTIVAEDGGIGRTYDLDPLGGRDDNGPIFPIGDRDLRLPVQEQVLGVILPDGTPVAFPAAAAREVLAASGDVSLAGVDLVLDGGGLRATFEGQPIPSHQAFWFAWSQFHPETLLWEE
ncbi:MAG: DUF3179 domain-containing (seleno)protein [Acidimicrobiia bacterium]|nr:DUF3179 domain-containing (seleno)protein [Acidimicrobiia bacterium]